MDQDVFDDNDVNKPKVSGFDSWVVPCDTDDEVSGDENTDENKILSQNEKKALCKKFTRVERCDHFFSMRDNDDSMGDVKSDKFIDMLKEKIEIEKKVKLVYAVIGIKNEGASRVIEIAFKLETKRPVSVGTIMKKIYKMFPRFHGEIASDKTGKVVYVKKARRIVAPLEAVDIDPNPMVYNETLYNLLRRIQNAEKGQEGPRDVWVTRTKEMEWAVVRSAGSWKRLSEEAVYKEMGRKEPLSFRVCFDQFSPRGENKKNPTEDHVKKEAWKIAHDLWENKIMREIDEDKKTILSGHTPKKRRAKGLPVGSVAPPEPVSRSIWAGRALR